MLLRFWFRLHVPATTKCFIKINYRDKVLSSGIRLFKFYSKKGSLSI